MISAYHMNPKVGGSSHFLSSKHWHFHKNIRSCVENEWWCPRRVNISNVNFTNIYIYHQSQYSKIWDSKCLALITQMLRAFGINPKVGLRVPLRSRHFCRRNFDTFTRISVRVSKMNDVARAQLTFQVLTLLQICIHIYLNHKQQQDDKS